MTHDLIIGLLAFAFVTSVTPGPNNIMLMTSGTAFGFRRTIPHMLGVSLGFGLMVLLVGAGLMGVFERWPVVHWLLKIASVTYLAYLAWKIACAPIGLGAKGDDGTGPARPMTFLGAVLFQWVNPKGWVMAVSAVSLYAPSRSLMAIAAVAAVFTLVNFPSVGAWAFLGERLQAFLGTPGRRRAFNWTMATALVASVVPML